MAAPLAARAGELGMLAADLAAEVAGYVDDLVADPLRLEAVGERRAQLAGLTRGYGPRSGVTMFCTPRRAMFSPMNDVTPAA